MPGNDKASIRQDRLYAADGLANGSSPSLLGLSGDSAIFSRKTSVFETDGAGGKRRGTCCRMHQEVSEIRTASREALTKPRTGRLGRDFPGSSGPLLTHHLDEAAADLFA
jgi:hypothetical protein